MLQTRIEFVTTGLFQLEVSDQLAETSIAAQSGLLLEREGDADCSLQTDAKIAISPVQER